MKKIIKDQAIVEDQWQQYSPEDDLPSTGDLLVPYEFWIENADALAKREDQTAPILNGELDFETVMQDSGKQLLAQPLIALSFPEFKDGRCYSFARLLRERYEYTGELRAIGDILQDQIFPMARCGINAFEVRDDRDPQAALDAFNDFHVKYQPAADEGKPLFRRYATA